MSLCVILYEFEACKFYLIPHKMSFVAWKQSYSRFSKQLEFSGSKIICILIGY